MHASEARDSFQQCHPFFVRKVDNDENDECVNEGSIALSG